MAHACPECDAVCHCGGDLEDLILEDANAGCTHCDDLEEVEFEDYDDEDYA